MSVDEQAFTGSKMPVSPDEVLVTVADLMSTIGPTVWVTQSLCDAAVHLDQGASAVVVVNLSHLPVGVITAQNINAEAASEPESWQSKRCAAVIHDSQYRIGSDESVETVIQFYQKHGWRPVVVFDGERAVGLLHPAAVSHQRRLKADGGALI